MDFLWHRVSEKEKQDIKKEAKSILDSFSKRLEDIKDIPEPLIERDEFEREENSIHKLEIDREIMFNNAKEKSDDFIVAEEGKW